MIQVASVAPLVVNVSDRTNWIFVYVRTTAGITGIGEASFNGYEKGVCRAIGQFGDFVIGREITVARGVLPTPASIFEALARCGLVQAFLDIEAKAAGTSVAHLLGGTADTVPVYANINRGLRKRAPDAFAAAAVDALANGFTSIKCAPFDGCDLSTRPGAPELDLGIERLRNMRAMNPKGMGLIVDCHWRFSLRTALFVASELEEIGVEWLEAPLDEGDAEEIKALRAEVDVPLAGGEWDWLDEHVRNSETVFDIVMPDVKLVGPEGLILAGRRHRISPHNPTGPISTLATIGAASATDRVQAVEIQFGESSLFADLVGFELQIRNGAVRIGDAPGLGAELNLKLAGTHPYRPVHDAGRDQAFLRP